MKCQYQICCSTFSKFGGASFRKQILWRVGLKIGQMREIELAAFKWVNELAHVMH